MKNSKEKKFRIVRDNSCQGYLVETQYEVNKPIEENWFKSILQRWKLIGFRFEKEKRWTTIRDVRDAFTHTPKIFKTIEEAEEEIKQSCLEKIVCEYKYSEGELIRI